MTFSFLIHEQKSNLEASCREQLCKAYQGDTFQVQDLSIHSSKDHTIATPVAGVYSPDAVGRVGLLNLSISMLNIWFSPTIYMFMKRAATTAYIIRVQMQQNETIIFFLFLQG